MLINLESMRHLTFHHETDNFFRWDVDVPEDHATFSLYIPQWRVPTPRPDRITVKIYPWQQVHIPILAPQNAFGEILNNRIRAEVERREPHGHVVHFAPIGERESWQIGEPYIPYSLLPNPDVDQVILEVEWE